MPLITKVLKPEELNSTVLAGMFYSVYYRRFLESVDPTHVMPEFVYLPEGERQPLVDVMQGILQCLVDLGVLGYDITEVQ